MVATAARAAGAGHGHRHPGQDQRLGQHGAKLVAVRAARLVQHRLGGRAGHGDREAVDGLAGPRRGKLPVGDRGKVADHVPDPGPDQAGRCGTDAVEVHHHADRRGHAIGTLARLVLQRADRGRDAVMSEVRGHRNHGDAGHERGELGHVDGPAATDAGHRLVAPRPQPLAQVDGAVHGGCLDPEDLGLVELEAGGDPGAVLAGPYRDGDPALGRDPAVRQQRAEPGEGPVAHIHGDRHRQQPGEQRHIRRLAVTDCTLSAIAQSSDHQGQGSRDEAECGLGPAGFRGAVPRAMHR